MFRVVPSGELVEHLAVRSLELRADSLRQLANLAVLDLIDQVVETRLVQRSVGIEDIRVMPIDELRHDR